MNSPSLFWVISGKNAYQSYLMILLLAVAVPGLWSDHAGQPASVIAISYAWSAITSGAATLCLLGAYWFGRIQTALWLELIGSAALGFASVIATVLVVVIEWKITLGLVLFFVLGLSSLGRLKQIINAYRQVKGLKREIEHLETSSEMQGSK